MKKAKLFGSLTLLSGVALTLAACGNNSNSKVDNPTKSFKEATPKKAVKKGGTVSVALETDTPITGVFLNELSDTQNDSDAMAPGNEALFDTNDTYQINDKGPATLKLDNKNKTATITVKKGVKWSDGKQVTAKDIEYSYEIIANKATKSSRYTESLQNIVGLSEYHDGKSNTISGIEMPDGENGRTVVLHFKEMKPGMKYSGNGYFWEAAAPYHYLKDVPFNKLQSSDQVRKNPLFFGPYKMSKVVRGQAVTFVPNKYYWRGTPKLDKVQNDSKDVDMFIGAWSLSSEPSPQDLYGAKAPFNYSRFVTKENTDLLNDIDSQKAFNNSYRVKKFHQWQAYMDKEAYVVPVSNSYSIYAVNNKLTGYSLAPSKSMGGGFPNWYYVGYAK